MFEELFRTSKGKVQLRLEDEVTRVWRSENFLARISLIKMKLTNCIYISQTCLQRPPLRPQNCLRG